MGEECTGDGHYMGEECQGTDITSERNIQGMDITCERNVQVRESCLQNRDHTYGQWTLHHTVC